ncbi:MAG TPA: hypothetical protein HPQ00_06250, partial [Magnetococcales bacterium]|nr:hypothetical protein [Magnetococcales bacterium]
MSNKEKNQSKPGHYLNIFWNYLMLLGIAWYGFSIPIVIALRLETPEWSNIINIILSTLFMVDIFIIFRTPFLKDNELVTDPRIIRQHYLKHRFALDLTATIPWDLILIVLLPDNHGFDNLIIVARMFRVLRLFRIPSIIANLRSRTGNALVDAIYLETNQKVRIFMLLFWVLLALNAIACGWILLNETPPNKTHLSIYIQAFYWLIVTVATVGYGDITPQTDIARIYATLVMMVGIAMYGYIIGNVSTTIANANAQKQRRQDKFSALADFMKRYDIPLGTQNDIFSFYDHFLRDRMTMATEILQELPQELR